MEKRKNTNSPFPQPKSAAVPLVETEALQSGTGGVKVALRLVNKPSAGFRTSTPAIRPSPAAGTLYGALGAIIGKAHFAVFIPKSEPPVSGLLASHAGDEERLQPIGSREGAPTPIPRGAGLYGDPWGQGVGWRESHFSVFNPEN